MLQGKGNILDKQVKRNRFFNHHDHHHTFSNHDDDEQTRGRIALQGDLRIVCVELASRQFHRGCVRGTAISQQQTWEYDHDEYDDNDFDHVDESCDSDHIKGV